MTENTPESSGLAHAVDTLGVEIPFRRCKKNKRILLMLKREELGEHNSYRSSVSY